MKKILFLSILFLFSLNVSFGGFDDLDSDNTELEIGFKNFFDKEISWNSSAPQSIKTNPLITIYKNASVINFKLRFEKEEFLDIDEKYYTKELEYPHYKSYIANTFFYHLDKKYGIDASCFSIPKIFDLPPKFFFYGQMEDEFITIGWVNVKIKNGRSSEKKNAFLFNHLNYLGKNYELNFNSLVKIDKNKYKVIFEIIPFDKKTLPFTTKRNHLWYYMVSSRFYYEDLFKSSYFKILNRFVSAFVKNSERDLIDFFSNEKKRIRNVYSEDFIEYGGWQYICSIQAQTYLSGIRSLLYFYEKDLEDIKLRYKDYYGDLAELTFYYCYNLIQEGFEDIYYSIQFVHEFQNNKLIDLSFLGSLAKEDISKSMEDMLIFHEQSDQKE